MGYSLTIEIPTAATDANKTNRGNKFAHNATRQSIKKTVAYLCTGKKPEKPLESFLISVVRHGPRALDFDNCIASLKAHIDGLTLAGIIKNDSWKFVRSIGLDQVVSKQKKLVITVDET
jgi:Holliday junction resolvase RusA-like endonuclease